MKALLSHSILLFSACYTSVCFKLSAQRNEIETKPLKNKQFQNSFETVLVQFSFAVRIVLVNLLAD